MNDSEDKKEFLDVLVRKSEIRRFDCYIDHFSSLLDPKLYMGLKEFIQKSLGNDDKKSVIGRCFIQGSLDGQRSEYRFLLFKVMGLTDDDACSYIVKAQDIVFRPNSGRGTGGLVGVTSEYDSSIPSDKSKKGFKNSDGDFPIREVPVSLYESLWKYAEGERCVMESLKDIICTKK